MRRWLTRILICLALGVVTTVGVAWGCVQAITQGTSASGRPGNLQIDWEIRGTTPTLLQTSRREFDLLWQRAYGGTPLHEYESVHVGRSSARRVVILVGPYLRRTTSVVQLIQESAGWPALSLTGAYFSPELGVPPEVGGGWAYVDSIPRPAIWFLKRDAIVLPIRPIFPGFAIDTLFYAALWLGLFLGFGAARRGLRKKRGRCPECAYDLRGDLDAGCSECGRGREEAEA